MKNVKCECQPDHECGDVVTLHKVCGREMYAIGARPVMDKNGPSYSYQGQDWICIGQGEIISVIHNISTLTSMAIVKRIK